MNPPYDNHHPSPNSSSNNDGSQRTKRALVIGAGPSGIVTAKYLLLHHHSSVINNANTRYDVTILESSKEIGGTFVNKVYDGTRLVSSKYITSFSDYRFDTDYSNKNTNLTQQQHHHQQEQHDDDHPTTEEYVSYLKEYANHFDVTNKIKYNCHVVSIRDNKGKNDDDGDGGEEVNEDDDDDFDSNGYIVKYKQTIMMDEEEGDDDDDDNDNGKNVVIKSSMVVVIEEEHYDVVAVCSGLHNTPYVPESVLAFKKTTKFHGRILHSSQYKDSSIFDGKNVLILGSGETAMDIALRAIRNTKSVNVALNVRRGFLSIPHILADKGRRPLDVFITNIFEHSYEHPWVHSLRLRWVLSTWIVRFFLLLAGSSVGFNQWSCPTEPIKRGYHIINKSHDAMSHMNVPIKQSWGIWGRFWLWFYGETHLRPIQSFHKTSVVNCMDDGKTIVFDDGRTFQADIIVLATGYRQSFPFLDESIQQEFRHHHHVSSSSIPPNDITNTTKNQSNNQFVIQEDPLPSQHFITNPNRPNLSFIGFVRPNVGASKCFVCFLCCEFVCLFVCLGFTIVSGKSFRHTCAFITNTTADSFWLYFIYCARPIQNI